MIKKDLNFGEHSIDTLLQFGQGTIGVNVCYDEEHNMGLVTFDQLDGFYEIGSEIEGTKELIGTPITEFGD